MSRQDALTLPALALQQGKKHVIYCFAIEGKQLQKVAQISRLGRDSSSALTGYQRPEVASHIAEIRNYLETKEAILPNAIVVAFDSSVSFEPMDRSSFEAGPIHGTLRVPLVSKGEQLPGWIVDGQQRAAAIREAEITSFPIFVTAFVTDNVEEQREQFILVNSTKPLPKGLIYELLPGTEVQLSSALQRKRFPAILLEKLNSDPRSPLLRAIQTPTNPFNKGRGSKKRGRAEEHIQGFIKDNSILRMLENSLNDGGLRFRVGKEGEPDIEGMLQLLFAFWSAVRDVFASSWNLPPSSSRLTHGIGIISMGHLMDAICDYYRKEGPPTQKQFADNLRTIAPLCAWISGHWDFGGGTQREWNGVQNTTRDIQMVANYLLTKYKHLREVSWPRSRRKSTLPSFASCTKMPPAPAFPLDDDSRSD
jgi:DGQHR domain-containing protein